MDSEREGRNNPVVNHVWLSVNQLKRGDIIEVKTQNNLYYTLTVEVPQRGIVRAQSTGKFFKRETPGIRVIGSIESVEDIFFEQQIVRNSIAVGWYLLLDDGKEPIILTRTKCVRLNGWTILGEE